MGSAVGAFLSYAPPEGSLWSMWINGTGSTVFYLTGPANSIVDLVLEQQILNDSSPTAVLAAVAGATVGQVYVRALDSNGSKHLSPVEYPTI